MTRLQACVSSNAVLLGAVGGPAFDKYAGHMRPEAGLLRLRRELGVFANLRPAVCFAGIGRLFSVTAGAGARHGHDDCPRIAGRTLFW